MADLLILYRDYSVHKCNIKLKLKNVKKLPVVILIITLGPFQPTAICRIYILY